MKIGIITDRQFENEHRVKTWFANITKADEKPVFLVGDGPGIDRLLQRLANNNKYDCIVFKPIHLIDPKAFFKTRYFFIRNQQIIYNSDIVVIFASENPDGGTKWSINFARKHKKDVFIIKS